MAGGLLVGQYGERTSQTTKKAIDPITSLTGIETQSDAWGKVIPLTFGRTRVPGVLVWASEFYKTTGGFDTTVTYKDRYYSNYTSLQPSGAVTNTTDVQQDTSSQTTRETIETTNIDLCYSFGKEGDPRRKRYVDVIRINEVEVYNSQTGYLAPNIGFNIRYGYDNSIDPLMAKYANGDLVYKGQTLIIFNKFPTADFGDAIPQSIDVEFGCLPVEQDLYPCANDGCGYTIDLDRHITRTDGLDRIAPGEVKWTNCHIILITLATHNDFEHNSGQGNNEIELAETGPVGVITFSEGYVRSIYHVVTEAEARDWNKNGVQLINASNRPGANLCTGRVRVIQIGGGFAVQTHTFQDPTEYVYSPYNWNGPGLVFRDAFVYAHIDGSNPGVVTSADPVISVPSAKIQQTSHKTIIEDDSSVPDGGQVSCPGRVYFAVMSTRISFTPCGGSL